MLYLSLLSVKIIVMAAMQLRINISFVLCLYEVRGTRDLGPGNMRWYPARIPHHQWRNKIHILTFWSNFELTPSSAVLYKYVPTACVWDHADTVKTNMSYYFENMFVPTYYRDVNRNNVMAIMWREYTDNCRHYGQDGVTGGCHCLVSSFIWSKKQQLVVSY